MNCSPGIARIGQKSRLPHEVAQVICEDTPEKPSTHGLGTEFITRGEDKADTAHPETVRRFLRSTGPQELRRTLTGALDNIILMAMRKGAAPALRERPGSRRGSAPSSKGLSAKARGKFVSATFGVNRFGEIERRW